MKLKILIFSLIVSIISCVSEPEKTVSKKAAPTNTPDDTNVNPTPTPLGPTLGEVTPTSKVGMVLRAFPYTNSDYTNFPTININDFTQDSNGKSLYATQSGLVISNSNGGYTTLSTLNLGISSQIKSVFIDSNAYIYISAPKGIAVSKDSGNTWTAYEIPTGNYYVIKFAQLTNGDVIGVLNSGSNIYRTSDGGDTWDNSQRVFDGTTYANGLSDLEIDSSGNIYVTASDSSKGGVYISTDGGDSFNRYTTAGTWVSSVFITDDDQVYLSNRSGTPKGIYKMSGSASNPTFEMFYSGKVAYDLHIHNNTFYVPTSNEGLLISRSVDSNGDRIWESSGLNKYTPNFIFDFVTNIKSFGNEVYFMGTPSWAYTDAKLGLTKTSDNGMTFEKIISEPPSFYTHGNFVAKFAIKATNNDIYIVHAYALYKSSDGGVTFTKEALPTSDAIYGVEIDSQGTIYFVTAFRAYKKEVNSTTYSLVKSMSQQIFSLNIDSSDNVWIGTNDGYYSSLDSYATKNMDGLVGYNSSTQTCDISGCGSTRQIVIDGAKRFLRGFRGSSYSLDSGATWTNVDFNNDSSVDTGDFEINSNGDIYFSSYYYNAMSTDGGLTWTIFGNSGSRRFRFDSNANVYYMSNSQEFCTMTNISTTPTCYGLSQGLGAYPNEIIFGANGFEFVYTTSGLFKFIE